MRKVKINTGSGQDPLREATTIAISRVMDPLLDLMVDVGVTVQELNTLIRERAVRNATKRVLLDTGRESRSRVAIATGIPRAEVARILKSKDRIKAIARGQHPARRVLAAWFEDDRFLSGSGDPAILSIFGASRSFEQLIKLYSSGTPVRAMLDELTRIDAIERLSKQRVRPKARVPILTGLNTGAIAMIGERGADLIETLVKNVRHASPPLFEATSVIDDAAPENIGLIRREIDQQAGSFINGINALLHRSRIKRRNVTVGKVDPCRLGVTVFYFADSSSMTPLVASDSRRKRQNLRRRSLK